MKKFNSFIGIIFIALMLVPCSLFSQTKAEEEGRAVWMHGNFFYKEEDVAKKLVKEKLDELERAGINTLFYYCVTKQNNFQWENLTIILDEAHKRNMEVHPIFMPGYTVALEGEIMEHPEWLMRGVKGEIYPKLNIALPEVREYMVGKIKEMLDYNIDGIHLDYIRFQVNQGFSYDKATCDAFKKIYGYSPKEVHMDSGSMVWCEWLKWNADQVTALVRDIKNMLIESGKDLVLGVDVFPGNEAPKSLIGQDWKLWVDEGLVDIVCPMDYINDLDLFENYVKEQVAMVDGKCKLYAGIAIHSGHNKNTHEGVKEEVRIAREVGADGMAIFCGTTLKDEFVDVLESFYSED